MGGASDAARGCVERVVERAVDVRAQRGVTCDGAEDGASRATSRVDVESKAPDGVGTFCSFTTTPVIRKK
jgi:hypothetical protein